MACGRGGWVLVVVLPAGGCGRFCGCAARRPACVRSATPTRRPVSRSCWARCRWWASCAGGWMWPGSSIVPARWARQWAVEEVFGIAADALNDDRIGRALDAMAPQLEQVIGSVGARAIATFGLEVARLHWDMTLRHEARWNRVACKDPPLGCRSSLVKRGAA